VAERAALVFLVALLVAAVSPGIGARAQQAAPPAALEVQLETAFQAMLADPADLDKSFAYAEIAIQAGDYEGAIGALERMLIYNPNLPRVRLELGVLYFRLGSYAVARSYLTKAVAGKEVPEAVRARVASYLAEIEKKASRHRFSGTLYGGFRYQSNANAGPKGTGVTILGSPATLDNIYTEQNDWSGFLSGALRHVYDPQHESGEVLESNLLLYGAKYFDQTQLDLGYVELKTGPRAPFMADQLGEATIRPYVLADYAWLEEARYFWGLGGGIELSKEFGSSWRAGLTAEHRLRRYRNSSSRPTNTDLNGGESELGINIAYAFDRSNLVRLKAALAGDSLAADHNSNLEQSLSLSYTRKYDTPIGASAGPWTSTLVGTFVNTNYDDPDPLVDPTRRRHDREWRVGLTTVVPITESLSIVATAQRTVVGSNFSNFKYDNWEALIGASWRF
jgi:hypothetical protein